MAADYFLKIDGIDGESTKKGFENQIEIESFSWGATQSTSQATGSGSGSGKVDMQHFSFTTKINKSSPKLMVACATGQHIPSAILTARKAGGKQEEYLKWKLSDIVVSSYQTGGSAGSDTVPTDQFSLAFSKIVTEYKPQDAKGGLGAAVTAGYDLKTMSKV
jgi:type VI secretion system secreted protein Hcp